MSRKDEVWQNRTSGYIEMIKPGGYDVLINGTGSINTGNNAAIGVYGINSANIQNNLTNIGIGNESFGFSEIENEFGSLNETFAINVNETIEIGLSSILLY